MSSRNNQTGTGGRTPGRLERNNYFYGKLLTVRDMEVEQAYHRNRLDTLSRFVTGHGTVCGLDVTAAVSTGDDGTDTLRITVEPGVAVDCCGRVLRVDRDLTESFALPLTENDQPVEMLSVYLNYRECFSESAPVSGLENACEEDCADNRIVEAAELDVRFGTPPEDHYKSVSVVDVPTPAEVGDRLSTVADAAPGTVFLRLDRSDVPESTDVELIKRGRSHGRIYNAGTEAVALDPGDTLVALDGRHYTVVEEQNPQANAGAVGPGATVYRGESGLRFEGFSDAKVGVVGGADDETLNLTAGVIPTEQETGIYADGRGNRLAIEAPDGDIDLETLSGLESDDLVIDTAGEPDDDDDDERILTSLARSYYDESLTSCRTCADAEQLLLGTLTRAGGSPPWRTQDFERGPVVYNNDMLYAALSQHVTNYRNPHQVGLEAVERDGLASLGVQGLQQPDGVVRFESEDETTLTIDADPADDVLTFSVQPSGGGSSPQVENRLKALERYALEKALRCKLVSFSVVQERFVGQDEVLEAVKEIVQAIDGVVDKDITYSSRDAYAGAMTDVRDREQELVSELGGQGPDDPLRATAASRDRYKDAVKKMSDALSGNESALTIAMAQECVATAAQWLTRVTGDDDDDIVEPIP